MYKGRIEYSKDDDYTGNKPDVITLELIEREQELAIEATTTWGEYGIWSADVVAM
ncbi:hypothetical protein GCM10025793_17940 [Lysobacter lycopersici]